HIPCAMAQSRRRRAGRYYPGIPPSSPRTEEPAMTRLMLTDRPLHPLAEPTAAAFKAGRLNRREFFASMAALGVSTAGALSLGGIALPARAQEGTPQKGGTLRLAMNVKAFRDPRIFDGHQI